MFQLFRAFISAAALAAALITAPAALAATATSPGGLTLSASAPDPVLAGVRTQYTVSVTNNTSSDFTFTNIGGSLPVSWTLNGFGVADDCARSNSNSGGVVRGPGFSCIWAVPGANGFAIQTLSPGQAASWTFTATASSVGTYVAQLSAAGSFPSGGSVSNTLNFSVPVTQGPASGGGGGGGAPGGSTDLQLTGSANTGSPALGSAFSYRFLDKNAGKADASGVTFDDPLPASVTGISVSTDTGTCSLDQAANTIHCSLGTLAAGTQAAITVNAVAPSTPGAVTNTASTTFAGTDSNPANNSANVTVQPR
jgi:uncharacterized repeat protein (TIGR01451 family)